MLVTIIVLATIGLIISIYAYIVEENIKQDKEYKPMCDISDHISCSKPLNSPYGKIFGITNSVVGIVFYASIIVLALRDMNSHIWFAAAAACIASVIFAYILIVKVRAFCVVCFSIYLINGLLLWVAWH